MADKALAGAFVLPDHLQVVGACHQPDAKMSVIGCMRDFHFAVIL